MKFSKIVSLIFILIIFTPTVFGQKQPPAFNGPLQPPPASTNSIGCPSSGTFTTVSDILNWGSCTISGSLIPLVFSLAVVVFLWGVVQFVINPENEDKKKKGKDIMIWGIIGLFVMISVWGLVAILGNTFGVRNAIPQLPQAH